MSKINLPASQMIGTPLTEEELKGIVGGFVHKTECLCTLHFKNGTNSTVSVDAQTSGACKTACKVECDPNEGCTSAGYSFSESYSNEA